MRSWRFVNGQGGAPVDALRARVLGAMKSLCPPVWQGHLRYETRPGASAAPRGPITSVGHFSADCGS